MEPTADPATLADVTIDRRSNMFHKRLTVLAVAVFALAGCSTPTATGSPAPSDSWQPGPSAAATNAATNAAAPYDAAAHDAELGRALASARVATARYVNDLPAARRDGYEIITQMMPGMGLHYLNKSVQGFDVTHPAILVYEVDGASAQLVALEWVFPQKPATPPLPGATYGTFAAACHYEDGTFKGAATEDECRSASPQTGSPFNFWHPDLVTLHVWLWMSNPAGIYHGTNPLIPPFQS
jgi:hypothetical protein